MENTAYRAIAIVGAGAVLPDAPNVPAFWENVKNGRYSITEVAARPLGSGALLRCRPQRAGQDLFQDRRLGAGLSLGSHAMAPAHPSAGRRCHGWVAKMGASPAPAKPWKTMATPKRPLDLDRTAVILGNALGGEKHYLHRVARVFP